MKKVFLAFFFASFLISNGYSETIKNNSQKVKQENKSCKIEKGVTITYNVKSDKTIDENLIKSLASVIDKRLTNLSVCHNKPEIKNNKILVSLSGFAKPEKITQFLNEKVNFRLKEPVLNAENNESVLWKDSVINQDMIASSKMVTAPVPQKRWQVNFKLSPEGKIAFKKILENSLYNYFTVNINNNPVLAVIGKSDNDDIFSMGLPVLKDSLAENEIFLSNLTDKFAKLFNNKNQKVTFNEVVVNQKNKSPEIVIFAGQSHLVEKPSLLKSNMIKDFKVGPQKMPAKNKNITFYLKDEQKGILETISRKLIEKPFAMEVNGKIVSQPVIREAISGNVFSLTGLFTEEDVESLISKKIKFKEPVLNEKNEVKTDKKGVILWKDSSLTGDMIDEIRTESQNPKIKITFNEAGKDLFAELTQNYKDNFLGIELNGKIISQPHISEAIKTGIFELNFYGSEKESRKLAAQLMSGQPEGILEIEKVKPF